MPGAIPPTEQGSLIAQLAGIADEPARRNFLRQRPGLCEPAVVDRIYEEVVRLVRADLQQADRLAQASRWLAGKLKDDYCRAQSLRATGHVLYVTGKYNQALARYQTALTLFERLGREVDVGRTLSGSLHALIYLGRYEQAFAWAQKAREIFQKQGDRLRLGRLDSNIGNILYRQDRLEEALKSYEGAHDVLRRGGEPSDVAAVLSNMAVCRISLNQFERALHTYREARAYCGRHGMPLLVAEADYNIAYLYYLRGEYARAIGLYQAAYAGCKKLDDRYHMALCDLDQSEMYLELNLSEEGARLAQQAFDGFKALGMSYEGAKALTNLAIAASHRGKASHSLELFGSARQLFVRERNQVWPALIDLYQALVLYREGHYSRALRLCKAAFRFFSHSPLPSKAALCQLLRARLYLQAGRPRAAQQTCVAVLKRLERARSPNLNYRAHFTLGQVEEALGNGKAAYQAYRKAHATLENLRSHLKGEELKIAFMKDKLAVYESLVWMCLEGGRPANQRAAFTYIEQAKSRSLADLIAFHAQALAAPAGARGNRVGQVQKLRQEINWCQRQIHVHELGPKKDSARSVGDLRRRIRKCENQLAKTLTALRSTDAEFAALQNAGTVGLEAIRSAIPADATLLEYYRARDTIYVCVLSRDNLKIVPVTSVSRVRDLLHLLQFQLSKSHSRPGRASVTAEPLHAATQAHLCELYKELLSPIRNQLETRHLIIVPHDFLHYLPFHALFDGEHFLIDEFSVSYAPSASVYYLCCTKKTKFREQALVLGVPDPLAPQILEEVRAVASTLPHSRLFVGAEATQDRLEEYSPTSRFVHIATHGLFRQDNPMFSSIRLGSSQLSLFDIYQLRLSSELTTLSGCSTGLNVVEGGDELIGLVRGLLYAGAQAVLASLWDVNDKSTAEFMKFFYERLRTNPNKALALQAAMRKLRENYPHPYYWAPFILIGKFVPSSP